MSLCDSTSGGTLTPTSLKGKPCEREVGHEMPHRCGEFEWGDQLVELEGAPADFWRLIRSGQEISLTLGWSDQPRVTYRFRLDDNGLGSPWRFLSGMRELANGGGDGAKAEFHQGGKVPR